MTNDIHTFVALSNSPGSISKGIPKASETREKIDGSRREKTCLQGFGQSVFQTSL